MKSVCTQQLVLCSFQSLITPSWQETLPTVHFRW